MNYSIFDLPIKVYGIYDFYKTKEFRRLPEGLAKKLDIEFLGNRTPGARMAFKTDACEFTVTIKLKTLSVDIGMSIYACQTARVHLGRGADEKFLGIVNPKDYTQKEFSATFSKGEGMQDIMIFLPRNEIIEDVIINIDDSAKILPPTPYKHEKPIVFFGSSITEGGCCASVTSAYTALISKWLDSDYYNYGFSGNCKGQILLADFFSKMDMSLFVLEYDYNAPSAEFLAQTHQPFFKYLRDKRPDLPILIMSAPINNTDCQYMNDRYNIVKKTYDNIIALGDKNVYFIDGRTFFSKEDRHICTVDTIHPNDLGFYYMAKTIYPVIKQILDKQK